MVHYLRRVRDKLGVVMDNMVNNMPQNDKTADATCVFRVPSSDVTVPDLMANVRITAPVLSIVKVPDGCRF